ncbi:hypothetical protein [Streptomyces caniferus]|uniref:hypothetical protein n=1 Tax=Streptomyces caniferus TaxID=285557 RepID=UPI0039A5859E
MGAPVDACAGGGGQDGPDPDGRGRSCVFEGGSIHRNSDTGAHEVHGAIRNLWQRRGDPWQRVGGNVRSSAISSRMTDDRCQMTWAIGPPSQQVAGRLVT